VIDALAAAGSNHRGAQADAPSPHAMARIRRVNENGPMPGSDRAVPWGRRARGPRLHQQSVALPVPEIVCRPVLSMLKAPHCVSLDSCGPVGVAVAVNDVVVGADTASV